MKTMESNSSLETTGRGLRASVILASLAICLLLFWGLKSAFQKDSTLGPEPDVARGSSFSPVARGPVTPPPPIHRTPPTVANNSNPGTVNTQAAVVPAPKEAESPVAGQVTEPPKSSPTLGVTLPRFKNGETGSATISGKVTLQGTPEPEKPIGMDPSCGALHKGPKPTTQFYVVASDGGLADVFVYISKGMENRLYPPPESPLVLDQIGCIYTPYVAGAMVGQAIEVRNSDLVLHNVHPTPAAAGNKEYNKAHMPKAAPHIFRWDKEELFLRFKCDVHPWMFAYVSLLPHPYFAVTDTNGNFTIPNVPAGKYFVKLLHRKAGSVTLDVIVEENGQVQINESLKVVR